MPKKIFNSVFSSLSLACVIVIPLSTGNTSNAQSQVAIKHTPWEMIRTEVVETEAPFATTHGDPANYKYATMPGKNDPRWTSAPVNAEGHLHFDEVSRIPRGQQYKKLDFTYFRSLVYIPLGTQVTEFRATIAQVDDGARMYLSNNSFPMGAYKEADDAKLQGTGVTADFTEQARPGLNIVTIVQFDDCAIHNRLLNGVEIKVNGSIAEPAFPAGSEGGDKPNPREEGSSNPSVGNPATPNSKHGGNPNPGTTGERPRGNPGAEGEDPNLPNGPGTTGPVGPTGNLGKPNNPSPNEEKKGTGGGKIPLSEEYTWDPEEEITFIPSVFAMETFGVDGEGRKGPEERFFIGWKGEEAGIITMAQHGNENRYIFTVAPEAVGKGIALKVVNYHAAEEGKSYYLPNLSTEPNVFDVEDPQWNERNLSKDDEFNFLSLRSATQPGAFIRHGGYRVFNGEPTEQEQTEAKSIRIFQQDATWHFHEITGNGDNEY